MIRTGLICVLAIAAVAGVLFGLYPELDLQAARHFHAVEMPDHDRFALRYDPSLTWARNFCLWIPALLVAPAVGALVIKLILPWRKLLIPGRAVVFLVATIILAPGIMAM
jgi:lipid A 4'-phosphatase